MRVAKPIGEIFIEVIITVGGAAVGAAAEEGAVGLVWGVAIESGGGAVFDIDDGAAAGLIRMVLDVVVPYWVVGPATIEDGAEEIGGFGELSP